MCERMEERGWSKKKLSDMLGVDPGNVSRMLKPLAAGGYATSAHAPRAGELVGVPLPSVPMDDLEASDLLRRLRLLSPLAYADEIESVRQRVRKLERLVTKTRNRTT